MDKVKEIKQSFRLLMNGVTAQSMRDKGVGYKINWGASFLHLKEMAAEYGKDYDLAIELWKEDIRECKILATLIMPADKISADVVEVWMEGVKTQEVAEMLAFNLLQYVDFAPVLAYGFIASAKPLEQICGFHILSRLFMKGQEPNEKGINEFIDQAQAALKDENLGVRHAAATCAMRFADLGIVYERLAKSAFKGILEI